MKKVNIYNIVIVVFLGLFCLTGCKKEDDIIKPIPPVQPSQPNPISPDNTYSRTVGFWDFEGNGNNSILNESENWTLNGVQIDENGLKIPTYINTADAISSRVVLFNPSFPNIGMSQQRYFSGAIKFKASKNPNDAFSYPILSFGTNPRFLDLEIFNGKIQMTTDNSNIVHSTNIEVEDNVWNVLYFRYEGFVVPSDNKFYLQLNDGDEVMIDIDTFDIYQYANDINLGFTSRGFIYQGSIDWVILGLGRMTPGNAQFLVEDLQN